MIDYETYCRIRLFHKERGLTSNQIGRELGIDPETAAKYAALDTYPRRRATKRPSKLDAFKPAIIRWLEHHPYSATQVHQRLCAEEGYTGGFSIVKQYVRSVRSTRRPAFLSLAFAPGEAAQVDWGSAGVIQIGTTRRRLLKTALPLTARAIGTPGTDLAVEHRGLLAAPMSQLASEMMLQSLPS